MELKEAQAIVHGLSQQFAAFKELEAVLKLAATVQAEGLDSEKRVARFKAEMESVKQSIEAARDELVIIQKQNEESKKTLAASYKVKADELYAAHKEKMDEYRQREVKQLQATKRRGEELLKAEKEHSRKAEKVDAQFEEKVERLKGLLDEKTTAHREAIEAMKIERAEAEKALVDINKQLGRLRAKLGRI